MSSCYDVYVSRESDTFTQFGCLSDMKPASVPFHLTPWNWRDNARLGEVLCPRRPRGPIPPTSPEMNTNAGIRRDGLSAPIDGPKFANTWNRPESKVVVPRTSVRAHYSVPPHSPSPLVVDGSVYQYPTPAALEIKRMVNHVRNGRSGRDMGSNRGDNDAIKVTNPKESGPQGQSNRSGR